MVYKKFKKGDSVLIMFRNRPYVGTYEVFIAGQPYAHGVTFPSSGLLTVHWIKDANIQHLNLKGN